MKKLLILLIILLTLVSCELFPHHWDLKLMVRGSNLDIYWNLIKDGEEDTGHYTRYPTKDTNFYDIEVGDGYTIKLYRVTETIIENGVEKRIIGETYETHFTIDHWETTISLTWIKEDGLRCNIMKEGKID